MRRIHLFEWEDMSWFPTDWRDYGTDYLNFIATKFDIYKPIMPIINRGIAASGQSEWVDCASGGGGGLRNLAAYAKADFSDLKVTVTDFYPNIQAFERLKSTDSKLFQFETQSVDARDVPTHLHGKFRTMFGSFHHFRPDDAQKILQNAVDTQTPIAIFEPIGRNFMSWLSMLFVPLNVLFLTPFIRPFRWQVLPFIYLLPLIPLYVLWDGIVSILRIYSAKELRQMVACLDNSDSFDWEISSVPAKPMALHYLLGTPKKKPE
jgi:hypothetical protein